MNTTDALEAARAVDKAVANLIPRDTESENLRDARCLLTSGLMRACGIQSMLRAELEERSVTDELVRDTKAKTHKAFGAPGDWSGELEVALRAFYAS